MGALRESKTPLSANHAFTSRDNKSSQSLQFDDNSIPCHSNQAPSTCLFSPGVDPGGRGSWGVQDAPPAPLLERGKKRHTHVCECDSFSVVNSYLDKSEILYPPLIHVPKTIVIHVAGVDTGFQKGGGSR